MVMCVDKITFKIIIDKKNKNCKDKNLWIEMPVLTKWVFNYENILRDHIYIYFSNFDVQPTHVVPSYKN